MNWNQTLCSNNDFETTCLSLWTPCFAFGFNKQKIDVFDGQVGTHWCGPALAYCGSNIVGSVLLLTFCSCLNTAQIVASPDAIQAIASIGGTIGTACYAGHFRQQIRNKYSIEGNLSGDVCTHFWCSPCALCQETSELKYQNGNMNCYSDITKAPYVQVMQEV